MEKNNFISRLFEMLFGSKSDEIIELQERTPQNIVNYAYYKLCILPNQKVALLDEDLATLLGISKSELYSIIQDLNFEIQNGYFALINVLPLSLIDLTGKDIKRMSSKSRISGYENESIIFDYSNLMILYTYLLEHSHDNSRKMQLTLIVNYILGLFRQLGI